MLNKSKVEITACPGLTFSVSISAGSSRAWFDDKLFIGCWETIECDIILVACTGIRRRKCDGRISSAIRMVGGIIMVE